MEDKRTASIKKEAEAEALKMLESAEQNLHQLIEEARRIANEEAIKTFKELEQKVRQIIHETIKIAEADAEKIVAQAEDKAHQIVEEAKKRAQTRAKADDIEGVEKVTAASLTQRLQQTLKHSMERVVSKTEDKEEKRKANHKRRVELMIIPPIDLVQLEKLRMSLQQLANLRILSMWGTPDGGASIFVLRERPAPLVPDLRKIDVVDEAIEMGEELLGSDLMNRFAEKSLPLRPTKHSDEKRILVLLKRAEAE